MDHDYALVRGGQCRTLILHDRAEFTAALRWRDSDEAMAFIVRLVPRQVRIGGEPQSAAAAPAQRHIKQFAADTLSHVLRVHGDLIEIRLTIDISQDDEAYRGVVVVDGDMNMLCGY